MFAAVATGMSGAFTYRTHSQQCLYSKALERIFFFLLNDLIIFTIILL